MQEIKNAAKNKELEFVDFRKKEKGLELRLKQSKVTVDTLLAERNIVSKNLLSATVSTTL